MSERVTADWRDDPVTFAAQGLMASFGAGTPREQMVWSVILATLAYLSALLSFGATAVFLVLFAVTFLVGALRLLWASVRG
ncbi:hypothetical protein C2R22_24520 (plasmid) [Salinigranum rubrum]|uniref:Uncharacterized protein n=1 Tax=Salinigranum rubrum TaxID=755307 RepID=A0A2I8VS33_9EURY|nr:hypothetical protein [Salinigranum rubrum]AUV84696.1 hypothetical protein C2R22_24520 [Salinigranum rubrum]